MGNLAISLKRFLGNKNTVTIIGVLAGIVVIYVGYNYRIKQAINPVHVPYAQVEIPGNTLIVDDMINMIKVSKNMVDTNDNLIDTKQGVIGQYSRYDTTIPEGSLFYKSQLMREAELPNSMLKGIPKGYTLFSLAVTLHSTYGNSIMPKDYIDLYIKYNTEDGLIKFGKFIEKIEVLAVKDSAGQHVFSSANQGTPSELLFAVEDDMYQLLEKSKYIRQAGIEIIPVPRNQEFIDGDTGTLITSSEVEAFINAFAVDVRQDVGTTQDED